MVEAERMHRELDLNVIQRGSFRSVKELITKIDHFVAHYNQNCKLFTWAAAADSILENINRLSSRISGTEHWT